MKRIAAVLLFLVAIAARAETPALLDEAIRKWIADEDHWAYTQRVHFRNGFNGRESHRVERFDPSLPDDQQWTLMFINGKPPTNADLAQWKRDKAREMRRRDEPLANFFELHNATVVEETAATVRYDVPLRKERYRRLPLEKIAVNITVDRQKRALVELNAGLKEAFRVAMGTAKVTDVEMQIRFKTVDEKYAPQPEFIRANGSARVAFVFRMGADADVTWSDFRRVVPYKTRFGVEIGELRALKF